MKPDWNAANREGYKAFFEGLGWKDNPYESDNYGDGHDWINGYNRAERDLHTKSTTTLDGRVG